MPLTLSEAAALDREELEHPKPTRREAFKAALMRRYSPRVHMSLILSASGLGAMLASWFLLHAAGVHSMLVRYPVAITFAYAIFLVGVWAWLRFMGYGEEPSNARNAKPRGSGIDVDIPSGSGGGSGGGGGSGLGLPKAGGGTFDGGGASASFVEGENPVPVPTAASGGGGGKGGGLDFGGDGDGIVLVILAIALVAVVFVTSGYLIWNAPDVLTEAAFGAALTGSLARPAAAHTASGWVAGVVSKTWWPFALVLAAATIFAGYASAHFPEASTFRQAVALAVAS